MSFVKAEDVLLQHGHRKRCYSILKTMRDGHLDFANSPINNYILKTLLMFECEKHANESEWGEIEIGDRIIGQFSNSRENIARHSSATGLLSAMSSMSTLLHPVIGPPPRQVAHLARPGGQGHVAPRP